MWILLPSIIVATGHCPQEEVPHDFPAPVSPAGGALVVVHRRIPGHWKGLERADDRHNYRGSFITRWQNVSYDFYSASGYLITSRLMNGNS